MYNTGTSLTTRYNSAILVNPFYPQAAELMNWYEINTRMYYINIVMDKKIIM